MSSTIAISQPSLNQPRVNPMPFPLVLGSSAPSGVRPKALINIGIRTGDIMSNNTVVISRGGGR